VALLNHATAATEDTSSRNGDFGPRPMRSTLVDTMEVRSTMEIEYPTSSEAFLILGRPNEGIRRKERKKKRKAAQRRHGTEQLESLPTQ